MNVIRASLGALLLAGAVRGESPTVISGTIGDARGTPLAGVEIRLRRTANEPPFATARSDGRFRLVTDARGLLFADIVVSPRETKRLPLYAAGREIALDVRGMTPRFAEPQSTSASLAAAYDAMLRRRDALSAALAAYRKSGQPLYAFRFDWSPLLREVAAAVAAERRAAVRQLLLFSYLDLGYGAYGATLRPALARQALAEIPPESPLWSIEPDLAGVAVSATGGEARYAGYLQRLIDRNPDAATRKTVAASYGPRRRIMRGKPAPPFDVAALDGGGRVSSDALKGKVYLIDFWATWCRPCIDEMDNLHHAHERYKSRGFEIVSLSLDEKPETAARFRAGTWKMPWPNGFLREGFGSEAAKAFELRGLPKPVLVGRDGRIVAAGMELRGPRLMQQLERLFGDRK